MEWVAKITTVALEMFLPALGGRYLDTRLGTNYWALVGLVLGMSLGFWHLLQMTRVKAAKPEVLRSGEPGEKKSDGGTNDG